MTDREMLELAAKAAGIEIFWKWSDSEKEAVPFTRHKNWYSGGARTDQTWNPLEDDGDALRLAVKLGIDIHFHQQALNVVAGHWKQIPQEELFENDPLAATRRAIVRAAAAIGESTP